MKKGIALLLALTLLLTLTACGQKETPKEETTQPPVKENLPVEAPPGTAARRADGDHR